MIVTRELVQKPCRFPIPFAERRLFWIFLALAVCSVLCASIPAAAAEQSSASSAPCSAKGSEDINIACDYVGVPHSGATDDGPRIVLNRAILFFKTKGENIMQIELTFTNQGRTSLSSARTVYLAVDDDAGQNFIRRILTHVDFRTLSPGKPITFSDRLLVGALRPGHYLVHLAIMSPDPSSASDSSRNLLLSNVGLADRQTGLNTIATFSVLR